MRGAARGGPGIQSLHHAWTLPPELARTLTRVGSLVALVVALSPPLQGAAHRYAVFETVQYCLLAVVVPALAVLGAPWRLLGLSPLLERLDAGRARRRTIQRAAVELAPALAVLVAWRTPALVDRLQQHPFLLALEAVTLVPAGALIWLDCVASPPAVPRLSPLGRLPVAAVSMWTLWILAYIVGMATSDSYPAFAHVGGRSLSTAADLQLTAGVMWVVAAAAFLPILFSNLMAWLRSDHGGWPASLK